MKLTVVVPKMKAEPWVNEGIATYIKKIKPFMPISILDYKTSSSDRGRADEKKEYEELQIFKTLDNSKPFILLDEKGKTFKNSVEFSADLNRWLESGWGGVQFVIGGAFGVSDEVKRRAQYSVSLSSLTFNHQLVTVVFLEQLYRGFTVLRNIPYHNE